MHRRRPFDDAGVAPAERRRPSERAVLASEVPVPAEDRHTGVVSHGSPSAPTVVHDPVSPGLVRVPASGAGGTGNRRRLWAFCPDGVAARRVGAGPRRCGARRGGRPVPQATGDRRLPGADGVMHTRLFTHALDLLEEPDRRAAPKPHAARSTAGAEPLSLGRGGPAARNEPTGAPGRSGRPTRRRRSRQCRAAALVEAPEAPSREAQGREATAGTGMSTASRP